MDHISIIGKYITIYEGMLIETNGSCSSQMSYFADMCMGEANKRACHDKDIVLKFIERKEKYYRELAEWKYLDKEIELLEELRRRISADP